MKKAFAMLLAVLTVCSLPGCAGEKRQSPEPELYIEPAQLNEDEEKMAQLLGGKAGQYIYDFSADDSVSSLRIRTWKLEDGEWTQWLVDRQMLTESSGRIALSFDDITMGCRIAVQTGSGFSATSGDREADEELSAMSRTTSYLTEREEITYDKEIPLAVQIFTDKDSVSSYDVKYFEHPEEYEKLGYEGVFAVTVCFSQEPLS